MAEVCALWAAIVDANEHLVKLDRKTMPRPQCSLRNQYELTIVI
jgi:hypothetical protein